MTTWIGDPLAHSCRLTNFDSAHIEWAHPECPILVVDGQVPHPSMDVVLAHRTYESTPVWWGVEVVAFFSGTACHSASDRFRLCMPLADIAGTRGIELLGFAQVERFDLPTLSSAGTAAPGLRVAP